MNERVEQLCNEFDEQVNAVGVGMTRHWWAKRLAELVEALDDLVSQVKHLEYPATALDLDQARAALAKHGGE